MDVQYEIKSIATLVGEPVRALMLWQLLDGRALTATELSIRADVSSQSASMHLNKLVEADLLSVEKQGRHRYYRFAKPEVAYYVESMANLVDARKEKNSKKAAVPPPDHVTYCRTCYDHLAGRVGVMVTDQLVKQKIIATAAGAYSVTAKGERWFDDFGVALHPIQNQRRAFARQCLDWSERRHHLAGALGAALCEKMFELGWLRQMKESRAVIVTDKGQRGLYERLKLAL